MLLKLILIDCSITNFVFNFSHNFVLNSFFSFFSISGMHIFIWLTIFAYLIFIEEKKHKEFIIFFLTSLLISSFLANVVIKNIVKRPRPLSQQYNNLAIKQFNNYPSDFSFPSGHATTSFAAATILAYFDKKRKKLFYLIAALIAFSRVYLGYHYFLDVVAGAIIGAMVSKTILFLNVGEKILNIKYKISNTHIKN